MAVKDIPKEVAWLPFCRYITFPGEAGWVVNFYGNPKARVIQQDSSKFPRKTGREKKKEGDEATKKLSKWRYRQLTGSSPPHHVDNTVLLFPKLCALRKIRSEENSQNAQSSKFHV